MEIYELLHDSNRYQNLIFENEREWEKIHGKFAGYPISNIWAPISVKVFQDDDYNKELPPSDFPTLGNLLVFSQHALDLLKEVLNGNGEILPLLCKDCLYSVYNVTHLTNALDTNNSIIDRFDDGEIMQIVKYEFNKQILKIAPIFKLKQTPHSDVYVTNVFVEHVQKSGLTGFDFRLIWSS